MGMANVTLESIANSTAEGLYSRGDIEGARYIIINNNAGWTPLKTGKSGTNKSDRKRNRKNRWR